MNSKLYRTKYTLPCCWIIWAVRKRQRLLAKAAVSCVLALLTVDCAVVAH